MDLDLNVLRLASRLAAHSSARQTVLSENVANADTPGYRARDLGDFAAALEAEAITARQTRPGHIPFSTETRGFGLREATILGAETPNGNSVSLEDQMMRAADVRHSHDMAMGVYSKSLDILRASLGRN